MTTQKTHKFKIARITNYIPRSKPSNALKIILRLESTYNVSIRGLFHISTIDFFTNRTNTIKKIHTLSKTDTLLAMLII